MIKYFCCPCKPTKSNGGRTWNLPQHAPEKWELFKKYNERDVQVEMQIQVRTQTQVGDITFLMKNGMLFQKV